MFTRSALIYIGQRFLFVIFTTIAVSSLVFLGVHQLPGNAFLSDRKLNPQALAELFHHYKLDLPLVDQHRIFTGGVLHGDLGESLVNRGVRIMPLLIREATVSAEVGGLALIFTVILGGVLGVIAALRQNSWIDYLATVTSVIGFSMPNFVIASVLLLLFGVWLYNVTGGAFYYEIGWNGTYGTLTDEIIEEMIKRGTVLVPTISVYSERGFLRDKVQVALRNRAERQVEKRMGSFRKAVESGVRIATGTDIMASVPTMQHGENAFELVMMARHGMKPLDVSTASTRHAAEVLGVADWLGTLQKGKAADVLVVEGDVLKDLGQIETGVRYVMKDGVVVVDNARARAAVPA